MKDLKAKMESKSIMCRGLVTLDTRQGGWYKITVSSPVCGSTPLRVHPQAGLPF